MSQAAPTSRPSPDTAFEGYPFVGRFLDLDGVEMHYLDEGRGPLIVMVHGNPTWSYAWRRLVLALRDDHRVLVPDHVGCGLSDKPDDTRYPYRLERRIDDLQRLIDHAAPDGDVTLVVHDWGGMIGLGWAARHPERLARLVLLNTAAFPLPDAAQVPLSCSTRMPSRASAPTRACAVSPGRTWPSTGCTRQATSASGEPRST